MTVPEPVQEMWAAIRYNGLADLMAFFSTPDKPVDSLEFFKFWISLSYEEMDYYRTVDLWEARRPVSG